MPLPHVGEPTVEHATQFDANIDDLDPRVWPRVIDLLLAAGAQDAWVTPIVMKKGRPAMTLSALCGADVAGVVRKVIFTETATIGLRETAILKHVLPRVVSTVDVDGHAIGIKTAYLDGEVVNRSIEWDDVVAAAEALDRPAKVVLDEATARLDVTG